MHPPNRGLQRAGSHPRQLRSPPCISLTYRGQHGECGTRVRKAARWELNAPSTQVWSSGRNCQFFTPLSGNNTGSMRARIAPSQFMRFNTIADYVILWLPIASYLQPRYVTLERSTRSTAQPMTYCNILRTPSGIAYLRLLSTAPNRRTPALSRSWVTLCAT